jgi:hypothetical protein
MTSNVTTDRMIQLWQCRPKVDDSYESGNQDEEDKQETNHVEPEHENGG